MRSEDNLGYMAAYLKIKPSQTKKIAKNRSGNKMVKNGKSVQMYLWRIACNHTFNFESYIKPFIPLELSAIMITLSLRWM